MIPKSLVGMVPRSTSVDLVLGFQCYLGRYSTSVPVCVTLVGMVPRSQYVLPKSVW